MLQGAAFRCHPILPLLPSRAIHVRRAPMLVPAPSSTRAAAVRRNSSPGSTPTNVAPYRLSSAVPSSTPPSSPTSAYVHLPFCRRRCHYCDFTVVALGAAPSRSRPSKYDEYDDDRRISDYIGLLLREIAATKAGHSLDHPPLRTIFFGGGTPSLVPPRLVSTVIDALRSKFGLRANPEISFEMDPGTFDAERLQELLSLGVNRVSLGVQAFQEELLRSCGRAHGLKEVHEALEIVTGSSGLKNWSVDLISSLPHQTMEMWQETLRLAVSAKPTHISVYDLQVEQGTKFGQLYTPGEFPLPSESQSAEFYKTASEILRGASYNHYEISSYCKSGFECKHNVTYWHNKSFYGFGLGSASYISGRRFSRPTRMKEYVKYVQDLEDGAISQDAPESLEVKDMAMDVVMLSLRMARGLDMKDFARNFGDGLAASVRDAFKPYMESGHVLALDETREALPPNSMSQQDNDCPTSTQVSFIRLADPEGFLLSNELISTAFGVISP